MFILFIYLINNINNNYHQLLLATFVCRSGEANEFIETTLVSVLTAGVGLLGVDGFRVCLQSFTRPGHTAAACACVRRVRRANLTTHRFGFGAGADGRGRRGDHPRRCRLLLRTRDA